MSTQNSNYNRYNNDTNRHTSKPNPSDNQPIKDQQEGRFEFKPLNPRDVPKQKNLFLDNLLLIGIFVLGFGLFALFLVLTDI